MTLTSHRLVVVTLCGRNIERLYSSLPSVSSRDVDGFGILIISCLSLSPYGKAGDVAQMLLQKKKGKPYSRPAASQQVHAREKRVAFTASGTAAAAADVDSEVTGRRLSLCRLSFSSFEFDGVLRHHLFPCARRSRLIVHVHMCDGSGKSCSVMCV